MYWHFRKIDILLQNSIKSNKLGKTHFLFQEIFIRIWIQGQGISSLIYTYWHSKCLVDCDANLS